MDTPKWWEHPLPYRVESPNSSTLYQSRENLRCPPHIERQLHEAGCTIYLNGKKLTQKEVRQRGKKETV